MTTQKKVETAKRLTESLNPKEFLTALQELPEIPDYQTLGFTLTSLCNLCKSALVMQQEAPEFIEHDSWDIFNVLSLISLLIPKDELELLDLLREW